MIYQKMIMSNWVGLDLEFEKLTVLKIIKSQKIQQFQNYKSLFLKNV